MAQLVINGPAIKDGVHNVVLRSALFHSPDARSASADDYHKVEVGIREGAYTSWIGTYDQSKQAVEGATPLRVLDDGREDQRVRAGQTLVVRITTTGAPASLKGCRVTFLLSRVGGRDGAAKPLVAGGGAVADRESRTAIRAVERQINTGGLSSWEDTIPLEDVAELAPVGTFQGRLERDSATQISLQRYAGNWIEIDGAAQSIGSSGLSVTASDTLLTSTGAVGSGTPSSSTLYYVYVGSGQLRLSATAPSAYLGAYYLGTDGDACLWRFCGWAYLDGSTQFNDSETAREVVNYYHRRPARLFTCPAYSDDNTAQTYAESSTTWQKVNAATGSDVSFIANGEDAVEVAATMVALLDTTAILGLGVGIDGITDVRGCQERAQVGTERFNATVPVVYAPSSAGRHTASLLSRQAAGSATVWADAARNGASADPPQTYLTGWVMV